jgi:uncharacterized protein (DUF305 family)
VALWASSVADRVLPTYAALVRTLPGPWSDASSIETNSAPAYLSNGELSEPGLGDAADHHVAECPIGVGLGTQVCRKRIQIPCVAAAKVAQPSSDRQFIDMMVPHHEGALGMAGIAQLRAERPELRQLAGGPERIQSARDSRPCERDIIEAQLREMGQMRTWRVRGARLARLQQSPRQRRTSHRTWCRARI